MTDIDYDAPASRQFESQIKKSEYELLGTDFNDGMGFFQSKLDIDIIYGDTPHHGLKSYAPTLQANSSITTQATSNLGASYSYGNAQALLAR